MKIAVPSNLPGGLDAVLSAHFGHADAFTLVEVSDQGVGEIHILPNQPHEQGGCMSVVNFLKNAGVDALMSGGMGARPLAGFNQVGIEVYFSENSATVGAAVDLFNQGRARRFAQNQVCGGGGGDCEGH